MSLILIAEDNATLAESIARALEASGHRVTMAEDYSSAARAMDNSQFDLVVTDLKLPDGSGMELLRAIKTREPETEVVLMTAFATVETAIEAMKAGAFDYLVKPFKLAHFRAVVERALELRALRLQNRLYREQAAAISDQPILGRSQAMKYVLKLISDSAPTQYPVLITGESGTGKELAARAVHRLSARKDQPFVPVNCAAISSQLLDSELFGHVKGAFTDAVANRMGLFEAADGGTIFLDEISEMAPELQAKLLRVLEQNEIRRVGDSRHIPVDIRLLSATNVDPLQAMARGKLREDLFYRINVVGIHLPALRERTEDIPDLAMYFLQQAGRKLGKYFEFPGQDTLRALSGYQWPGNVRELKHVIERAAILCPGPQLSPVALGLVAAVVPCGEPETDSVIFPLPKSGEKLPTLGQATEEFQRELARKVLDRFRGNQTLAAKALGIGRTTLWRKLSDDDNPTVPE